MKHNVEAAGNAKTAIKELQGLLRNVVTGAGVSVSIPVPGLKVGDALFSVIGFDGDGASLAVQVVDFTADCSMNAIEVAVAGITLSGVLPVSIEATAHGLVTGEYMLFDESIVGTTELNGKGFTVVRTDADNFTLVGTNSANFTGYTSGGDVITQRSDIKCTSSTAAYRLMIDSFSAPAV